MSYQLESGETLPHGLKRIAREQIDNALDQLAIPQEDRNEAVHDARKRFKKIRAVLRLVRDEIGEAVYRRENVCFRDAGRRLAEIRDSYVLVETIDALIKRFVDPLASDAFAQVRRKLLEQHRSTIQHVLEEQEAAADVVATLEAARKRVDDWPIIHTDFSALRGGLRRVYKRGRHGMKDAYDEPIAENFHEWRKRVKYLWYHTRILQPLWPNLLDELAGELHELANYLGDDHDLAELRRTVLSQPALFADERDSQCLIALIDQRRTELEAAARPLGERIYVEKPDDFVDRLASYWPVWQKEIE